MTFIERFFALKANPCFRGLDNSELSGIAGITGLRRYAPGEQIAAAQQLLTRLYVVTEGRIENHLGNPMPPVIGAASLLGEIHLTSNLYGSQTEGAVCLVIGKGHFFTIIHQCPSLITGLLELPFSEVAPEQSAETVP